MNVQIIPLTPDDRDLCQQAAVLLVAAFAENWPDAWPTIEEGQEEVAEALDPEKIVLAAVDQSGRLLGWIGGQDQYDVYGWELHPLVVDPALHGQGIGRLLVTALEKEVASRGATTLYLGSDDVNNMTSLAGKDLYPNVFEHIVHIQNYKNHPFSFYQKLGFVIVGVIPDANGPGKPDIMMAKRINN